jgi:RNA polymerase sigma factor (TIGR02999 family)
MSEVTDVIARLDQGDATASADLLPLVYDELRKLAAARMARESAEHTLQPTALVHEAYVRLVGTGQNPSWNSRGHFFAAAAEAMRRIVVDRARQRASLRRGGHLNRVDLSDFEQGQETPVLDLVALDAALRKLEQRSPRKAELVKLRFFAGLTIEDSARVLDVSTTTAENDWAYAKCWLKLEMSGEA